MWLSASSLDGLYSIASVLPRLVRLREFEVERAPGATLRNSLMATMRSSLAEAIASVPSTTSVDVLCDLLREAGLLVGAADVTFLKKTLSAPVTMGQVERLLLSQNEAGAARADREGDQRRGGARAPPLRRARRVAARGDVAGADGQPARDARAAAAPAAHERRAAAVVVRRLPRGARPRGDADALLGPRRRRGGRRVLGARLPARPARGDRAAGWRAAASSRACSSRTRRRSSRTA